MVVDSRVEPHHAGGRQIDVSVDCLFYPVNALDTLDAGSCAVESLAVDSDNDTREQIDLDCIAQPEVGREFDHRRGCRSSPPADCSNGSSPTDVESDNDADRAATVVAVAIVFFLACG